MSKKLSLITWLFGCVACWPLAYPVGLGTISVDSKLNQPFRAQIDLVELKEIPIRDLRIELASKRAFERAGLIYSNYLGILSYKVIAKPRPHILVKSKESMNEPLVNLMLRLYWPKGEVYRAYSVLLDPADYLLERFDPSAVLDMNKTIKLEIKKDHLNEHHAKPKHHVQDTAQSSMHYLKTKGSDSLWKLAETIKRHSRGSIYQIMLAVFEKNPNGFVDHNINHLKSGIRIMLPSEHEIKRYAKNEAYQRFNHAVMVSRQPHDHHDTSLKNNAVTAKKAASEIPAVENSHLATRREQMRSLKPPSMPVASQEPEPLQKPTLEFNETVSEEEANLWFLDTLDFSDEIIDADALSKLTLDNAIEDETTTASNEVHKATQASAFMPTTLANNAVDTDPVKSQSTHTTPPNSYLKEHERVKSLLDTHTQTLQSQAKTLHQKIDKQMAMLNEMQQELKAYHATTKSGFSQGSAIVAETDNFWTLVFFFTTLLGGLGTAFFGYRLHVISTLKRRDASDLDIPETIMAQDAIAQSKRKIEPVEDPVSMTAPVSSKASKDLQDVLEHEEPSFNEKSHEDLIQHEAAVSSDDTDETIPEALAPKEEEAISPMIKDELEIEEIFIDDKPTSVIDDADGVDATPTDPVEILELDSAMDAVADDTELLTEAALNQFNVEFESGLGEKYSIGRKGERQAAHAGIEQVTQNDEMILGVEQEQLEDQLVEQYLRGESRKITEASIDDPKRHQNIETKLDLARAYMTMNDAENAQAILCEILDEGNAEQISIAKKLMDELDKGHE